MQVSMFRVAVLLSSVAASLSFDISEDSGDVVVYGATAAGCVAAIAAARSGAKKVLLVTPYKHIGGMTTGGLMHADSANESTIAGITLEFFLRVEKHYAHHRTPTPETTSTEPSPSVGIFSSGIPVPKPNAPVGWLYESHVAEQILEQMIAESNITLVREVIGLAAATKRGTVLQDVMTESGVKLSGKVWIDASYEGDLAAVAGADMVWGRESVTQYNEPDAGRQPASIKYTKVDPYWPDGSVIPHVSAAPLVGIGERDSRIEDYDFRLCMTNSPSHRVPLFEPQGYNASEWEFWRRYYTHYGKPDNLAKAGLHCLGPIPNNYTDCDGRCVKCDMLGMQHGTDMLNGGWGYPNATTAQRKAIRQAHIQYTLGLLWFWATDPSTGDALHQEMASLGLCNDEYVDGDASDPPYWPYQLYVREARRLVGDFVWTELDPSPHLLRRSIGVGSYSFDSHWVSLYIEGKDSSAPYVAAEGRVHKGRNGSAPDGVMMAPYEIPYDVLIPKAAQLSNVLVPVACSSSHVRFNAIRMEPIWMIMGHAAGAAAVMALKSSNVQNVDVAALQATLLKQKQMIWSGAALAPSEGTQLIV